jgi:hypothetical protein
MALVRAAEIAHAQGYQRMAVENIYSAALTRLPASSPGSTVVELGQGTSRTSLSLPPTRHPEGMDPFARLVVVLYRPGEAAPANSIDPQVVLAAFGAEMGVTATP